jgi:osomolarity two-component system, sensor histidine kinase NIK1
MDTQDQSLLSAAFLINGLGRGGSSRPSSPQTLTTPSEFASATGTLDLRSCKISGPTTPAKASLEAEIFALSQRVRYLESRADSVNQNLPDTPNEVSYPSSIFSRAADEANTANSVPFLRADCARPVPLGRRASLSNRSVRIQNLLAARDSRNGDVEAARTVSEDDISYLRDHVQKQAEEIKSQRYMITDISKGLHESDQKVKLAVQKAENDDIGMLERELRKHQQANEAFQKALREIGGIITQVANGDLSMRVHIQNSEMDAEISTFKRTINTMMDQLEIFGSEVSRVAREVGTEGTLGGQAQISGVHGIWKELTDNGKSW